MSISKKPVAAKKKRYRPDQDGTHRAAFDRAKKKIYATQTVCGICGKPVDFSLKFPNPMSKCIDHIIPIDKGGHPSDLANLQLAHLICNRIKSDHLGPGAGGAQNIKKEQTVVLTNRNLPQSTDWANYKG